MDFRLILGFARPWRGTLALCALLMLAETGVALAVPWLAGQFAGQLLSGLAHGGGLLLAALLVLFGAQALLKFANSWLLGRTAEYILADLRTQLYDHLQALPLAYFQQRRHGEILALLTNDVARLASYISGTLLSVVPLALTVAGAALMMLRIDARLTLLVVLMIPLFYVLLKVLGRRLRPLSSQLQQAHADSVAIAEENLSMLPAIKTFTREPLESARYRDKIESILHLSNQERLIYAALGPGVQFLAAAGMVLILWQLSGPMAGRSPADIVSFLLYATLLTRPVSALADVYGQTRQAHGALERLSAVLTERPEPAAREGQALPPVHGEIAFQSVRFAYPGRPPALDGITLHLRAGETIALTGANGAGKSTLAHLLMRLITPASGRILIDGIDIATVTLASGRKLSDSGAKARLYHEVKQAHLAKIVKVDLKSDLFSYAVDEGALAQAELMDGKLLLVTNVADLMPVEVVKRYKALADIERGFRVLKSEIEIAPVYHRLPERIRAYAMVCFMALIVYRVMRQRLALARSDLTPEKALAQLRKIQRHSVRINQAEPITGISTINDIQAQVLQTLNIKKPTHDAQLTLL